MNQTLETIQRQNQQKLTAMGNSMMNKPQEKSSESDSIRKVSNELALHMMREGGY